MERQTSIDSFKKINENGLLNRMENLVYNAIFENGPLTIKETFTFHLNYLSETSVSPIFARLLKKGVVRVIGERKCRVTGNNVCQWDVTDQLPVKVTPPKKKKCETCGAWS